MVTDFIELYKKRLGIEMGSVIPDHYAWRLWPSRGVIIVGGEPELRDATLAHLAARHTGRYVMALDEDLVLHRLSPAKAEPLVRCENLEEVADCLVVLEPSGMFVPAREDHGFLVRVAKALMPLNFALYLGASSRSAAEWVEHYRESLTEDLLSELVMIAHQIYPVKEPGHPLSLEDRICEVLPLLGEEKSRLSDCINQHSALERFKTIERLLLERGQTYVESAKSLSGKRLLDLTALSEQVKAFALYAPGLAAG